MPEMSPFAEAIFRRTYAFHPTETWEECAHRVAKAVAHDQKQEEDFFEIIRDRIFIPGGRYLYTAGRPIFQNANCFGFIAEDSREGWAKLLHDSTMCLSMGGGIGVNYSHIRPKGSPVGRMGGTSSGPIALMQMINEVGRHVMSGGARRSAIWAGLGWQHDDILDFVRIKDWDPQIQALKAYKYEYPAPLDMTNISIIIDDEYIQRLHKGNPEALAFHNDICNHMARTGEPAFRNQSRILVDDPGAYTGNPCVPAHAIFVTKRGLIPLQDINSTDRLWTGKCWAPITKIWKTGQKTVCRYTLSNGLTIDCTDDHRILQRGQKIPISQAKTIDIGIADGSGIGHEHPHPIIAGIAQGDGTTTHGSSKVNNVWIYIGAKDGDIAEYLTSTGFVKTIAEYANSQVCYVIGLSPEQLHVPRQKLPQRNLDPFWFTAHPLTSREFLRGLFSANGNILGHHNRIALKTSNRTLAGQIQLLLARLGFRSYITTNKAKTITWRNGEYLSKESYNLNIAGYEQCKKFEAEIGFIQKYKMLQFEVMIPPKYSTFRRAKIIRKEVLGEMDVFDFTIDAPEHTATVNGLIISNCQEAVLHHNDSCNLGSIVLPRIRDLAHLEYATRLAIQFLYNGSITGEYPTYEITETIQRNRRIGLGIMGLHEYMLLHGRRYEWFPELEHALSVWKDVSNDEAHNYARKLRGHTPITTRAIAPTGTISIIAETTSGIEPIFCTAYKRRYLKGDKHYFQYVVDPTAQRLIQAGLPETQIEDAYQLSHDFERRLAVQAHVQDYVDQAISSTVNLPAYGEPGNSDSEAFATTIVKYLPSLKGITMYPNNSRPGQPLVPITVDEARGQEGVVYEEDGDKCASGVCGL